VPFLPPALAVCATVAAGQAHRSRS
jgi:hypothetical protein